jgi:hypothetical protein
MVVTRFVTASLKITQTNTFLKSSTAMAQRKVQVLTNNVLMLTLIMVLIFHASASVAVFNETGNHWLSHHDNKK